MSKKLATMPTTIYDHHADALIPMPDHVAAFLREIEAVQRKYKMSIYHEDEHGSFEILSFNELYLEWLFNATLLLDKKE